MALQHEGELELARLEAKRLAEEEARRAADEEARLIEAEEIREVERREDAEAHARKVQQDRDEEASRRRNLHVYIVRPLRRNDGMVMSYATEYYKRHAVVFTRWSNAIPTSAPEPKTEAGC